MITLCIIGCGSMAANVHMPAIVRYQEIHGGVNIAACADLSLDAARLLAKKYGIPNVYRDYSEMLEIEKPDAVAVLVSETAVSSVVCNVLKHGCNTIFEKPPGKTLAEIDALIDDWISSQKLAMVAFNRRYSPVYTRLTDLIGNRRVQHIVYNFHRVKRRENHFEDTAIHAVDTVKFLAGSDYRSVELRYANLPEFGQKVANYFLYCEFTNGVTAQINIIVSTGSMREGCEIYCDESVFYAELPFYSDIGESPAVFEVINGKIVNSVKYSDFELDYQSKIFNGFYDEHQQFFDALKHKKPLAGSPDTARQSVILCEAIKNRTAYVEF